jgi:hypothetical protein
MLEKMAEALALAYNDAWARRQMLGASFDPATAAARAALQSLLQPDEGTVEAMATKLHAYDWNGVVKWADETDEIRAQYRQRVTFSLPAALNHILDGE